MPSLTSTTSISWPLRPAAVVVCVLLFQSAAPTFAWYAPPGVTSVSWMRNAVLAYMDSRSLPPLEEPEFVWSPLKYQWLLAHQKEDNDVPTDVMFDSFVLLGISWKGGKNFWPGIGTCCTNQSDWRDFADLQFNQGVHMLSEAAANVSSSLRASTRGGRNQEAGCCPRIVHMIPYPDQRQRAWGKVGGRTLDFSTSLSDRVSAVEWYVDYVRGKWAREVGDGTGDGPVRVGFYWFYEEVSAALDDHRLVPRVSDLLHSRGESFVWIPFFGAQGVEQWRTWGFDAVTLQPNFAFQNVSTQRFAEVASMAQSLGMGVEQELPMAVRNPNVNWTENFDAYMHAGVKYTWMRGALRTWYYGNAFVTMAKEARAYYDKLFDSVKGTLGES